LIRGKRLLQSEPEEAGILTFFSLPVWCLLVVIGLLVGYRLGVALFGTRRAVQRQGVHSAVPAMVGVC
jgi:hypothetical protein